MIRKADRKQHNQQPRHLVRRKGTVGWCHSLSPVFSFGSINVDQSVTAFIGAQIRRWSLHRNTALDHCLLHCSSGREEISVQGVSTVGICLTPFAHHVGHQVGSWANGRRSESNMGWVSRRGVPRAQCQIRRQLGMVFRPTSTSSTSLNFSLPSF